MAFFKIAIEKKSIPNPNYGDIALPADVWMFELLSHLLLIFFVLARNIAPMFHLLSEIDLKNPIYFAWTVLNSALNRRCVVVFDRLWANAASTFNTAFSLINVHAKLWMHSLQLSPLLSHAISICYQPQRFYGLFLYFLEQLPNSGNLSVQRHLYFCDHV